MSASQFYALFQQLIRWFDFWFKESNRIIIGPLTLFEWLFGIWVFGLIITALMFFAGLSGPLFSSSAMSMNSSTAERWASTKKRKDMKARAKQHRESIKAAKKNKK